MAKYYAVERSNEYLAHYGIRGMKWGVRKAREKKNNLALSLHYMRAKAKLRKLKHESNWYVHDLKGQAWEKLATSKHGPVRMAGHLVGAGIRSKIHYLKSSDPGDLYMDHRRDKFQNAMNEAFRGTKYDARIQGIRKYQQKQKIRKALGLKRG